MQRLGPQDAMMVYAEQAGWAMQTGSLAIYDTRTSADGLSADLLREFFEARLPQIPGYRQRLVTVPGGLASPMWVEDDAIDLDHHVQEVALPSPGGPAELCALVAELIAIPLDLNRPLWRNWVITGLESGNVAVLAVVHHAVSDGVRGADVTASLFDVSPDAPFRREGVAEGPGRDLPGPVRLLGSATADLAATPWRVARAGFGAGRAAVRIAGTSVRGRQRGLSRATGVPTTRFNGQVGEGRLFDYCTIPLPELKDWAKFHGGSVNDALLTLTGGALRRYLLDHDELPDKSLVATIPVGHPSLEGSEKKSGNSFSVMTASLGTDVADPVERMHRIMDSTQAAKAVQDALGDSLFTEFVHAVPPPVFAFTTKAYYRLGLARFQPASSNATVSNVRGPGVTLYLAGSEMLAHYPVGPLADGLGLNVTVMSYRGTLYVGVTSSPALISDLDVFTSALRTEIAQLTDTSVDRKEPS